MLIPKEAHPTSIRGFRPLSLCNVPVKLISRIIVSRLKETLKNLIPACHTSFVPGRQGMDNVVLCQEMVHYMRYTKAKRGAAIIKVDLEKTYDCLEWTFIESTLENARMPKKIIDVIMCMILGGSYKLLWNGELTDEIRPSRGFRKGDPLSPYLFVLCLERLGHWIRGKVEEGRLRPLKDSRSGQGLPYIFFADDLLLFSEAVED